MCFVVQINPGTPIRASTIFSSPRKTKTSRRHLVGTCRCAWKWLIGAGMGVRGGLFLNSGFCDPQVIRTLPSFVASSKTLPALTLGCKMGPGNSSLHLAHARFAKNFLALGNSATLHQVYVVHNSRIHEPFSSTTRG